jgi:hypothetical protein
MTSGTIGPPRPSRKLNRYERRAAVRRDRPDLWVEQKKQPVVVQVQNEANFYQITQRLAKRQLVENREGRAGSRIIRIRPTQENTTVSSVCDQPARDRPVTFATTTRAQI